MSCTRHSMSGVLVTNRWWNSRQTDTWTFTMATSTHCNSFGKNGMLLTTLWWLKYIPKQGNLDFVTLMSSQQYWLNCTVSLLKWTMLEPQLPTLISATLTSELLARLPTSQVTQPAHCTFIPYYLGSSYYWNVSAQSTAESVIPYPWPVFWFLFLLPYCFFGF